jgi:hypothetical protein
MPRNSYRTNFVQEMHRYASDYPFPGNIKFAIRYRICWQNRSTRFVHQCIRGTSVMWPSHARDWSRQHTRCMCDLHKRLQLLLMSPQKFGQGSTGEHVLTSIVKVRLGHIVCFGEFAQVNPFWIDHVQQ